MKQKYVVFFKDRPGARIFINHESPTELEKLGVVLENPDLSEVENIPPELWSMDEKLNVIPQKKVVSMNAAKIKIVKRHKLKQKLIKVGIFVLGLIIGILLKGEMK